MSRLIEKKGGQHIWLPKKAFVGNWFTDIAGLENAQAVIDRVTTHDGDGRVIDFTAYIPLGESGDRARRLARVREMAGRGMTRRDIATTLGLSEKTVQRLLPRKVVGPSLVSNARKSKPRIGVLELMILDGKPDTLISAKTKCGFREINRRRKTLRKAGLLGRPEASGQDAHLAAASTSDLPAQVGEMVSPSDEGAP